MTERFELQGSEAELNSMVHVLDDMHNDAMPKVHEQLAELTDSLRSGGRKPVSRRLFVMGGLGTAGALTLAACGKKKKSTPSASSSNKPDTGLTGDLKVVGLAAALENLAVAAYGYVLTEAGKGKYGTVPPAIGTFATVAKKQHADHASAWNGVLTGAGYAPVTTAAVSIAASQVSTLESHTTLTQVAMQALTLEEVAAATYLFAAANVSSAAGIATAATIAPVEYQHAAILNFVLGAYPLNVKVGNGSFLSTSMAVGPADFTG